VSISVAKKNVKDYAIDNLADSINPAELSSCTRHSLKVEGAILELVLTGGQSVDLSKFLNMNSSSARGTIEPADE